MTGRWWVALAFVGALLARFAFGAPPPTGSPSPEASSQPSQSVQRTKTLLEIAVEETIDEAFQECLRVYEIQGKHLLLRVPFGQNDERRGSPGFVQRIFLGGKGEPEQIWRHIDSLLASPHFSEYARRLELPGKKIVAYDLERRRYSVFFDPGLVKMLEDGAYPGTRTRVYVLKPEPEMNEIDVYNYLYCIGAVGMDCSGFVYYIQKAIGRLFDRDVDEELARVFHIHTDRVSQVVGLWLFNPKFSHATRVRDRVLELRPGDVFLFRGRVPGRGIDFRHSAVIQSIDLDRGYIRYFQCTDWAPQEERGVHESYIYFDPIEPEARLTSPGVTWTQEIFPTFPGEPGLRYWRNDGDRYRSYMDGDGSLVVRLNVIRDLLESLDPDYY